MSAFEFPASGAPAAVAGALAHYDASDTASLTITANKVSQWNDLSGNGHNLTQGTAGSRPLYSASPRTINAVTIPEFTGGGEFMDSTCPMDDRTFSVYLAILADSVTTGAPVADTQGGGFEVRFNASRIQHLKSGVAVLGTSSVSFAFAVNRTQVYGSRMDASTHYFGFPGGASTASDSTTFTAGRTLRVGKDSSATILYDGLIAELLFYNTKLSDADHAQNLGYLAHKWYA